jgi:NADPH:quinone reductase-like Zn-dependent oxidoreductase
VAVAVRSFSKKHSEPRTPRSFADRAWRLAPRLPAVVYLASVDAALIYGASGSVGIFAVQLAKHFGAHVTGVCSTKNLDLVKSLGADEVIDYTKDDFSKSGRIYDIVLDSVGKSGYSRSLRSLKRGGFYVRVGGSGRLSSIVGSILAGTWISLTGAARFVGGVTQGGREAQAFLKDLIEAGKIRTVIDRRYSLDQIVEAHRYVEAGHKIGNVVIVV